MSDSLESCRLACMAWWIAPSFVLWTGIMGSFVAYKMGLHWWTAVAVGSFAGGVEAAVLGQTLWAVLLTVPAVARMAEALYRKLWGPPAKLR